MRTQLAENAHVKWFENRRGYYTSTVNAQQWTTEYRSVPFVTKPGAPIETPSRWRTMHGKAGIERL